MGGGGWGGGGGGGGGSARGAEGAGGRSRGQEKHTKTRLMASRRWAGRGYQREWVLGRAGMGVVVVAVVLRAGGAAVAMGRWGGDASWRRRAQRRRWRWRTGWMADVGWVKNGDGRADERGRAQAGCSSQQPAAISAMAWVGDWRWAAGVLGRWPGPGCLCVCQCLCTDRFSRSRANKGAPGACSRRTLRRAKPPA